MVKNEDTAYESTLLFWIIVKFKGESHSDSADKIQLTGERAIKQVPLGYMLSEEKKNKIQLRNIKDLAK